MTKSIHVRQKFDAQIVRSLQIVITIDSQRIGLDGQLFQVSVRSQHLNKTQEVV